MNRNFMAYMTCPFCGKSHSVATTIEACIAWSDGALIQDAMPFLSVAEREQLISHICPSCQKDIFGTDDEYFPPEPDNIDNDCGFDPYVGCYTGDC